MIAVPIAVVLFGYWVLYAGIKGPKVSLADAYRCVPQQQQTAGDQSGNIKIVSPEDSKRLRVPPGPYTRIPGTDIFSPTVTGPGLGPQQVYPGGVIGYIPPINRPSGQGDLVGRAGQFLGNLWDQETRDVKNVASGIGGILRRFFGG